MTNNDRRSVVANQNRRRLAVLVFIGVERWWAKLYNFTTSCQSYKLLSNIWVTVGIFIKLAFC